MVLCRYLRRSKTLHCLTSTSVAPQYFQYSSIENFEISLTAFELPSWWLSILSSLQKLQNYIIHCIDFVMRGESQAFRFYLYHLLPHLPNTFVSSTLRTVLDGQPPPTHTHTPQSTYATANSYPSLILINKIRVRERDRPRHLLRTGPRHLSLTDSLEQSTLRGGEGSVSAS